MILTKLNENYSIHDTLNDWEIVGNVDKNADGVININIDFQEIDNENAIKNYGHCSYNSSDPASFYINVTETNRRMVSEYFNNLVDAVLNDSAIANS